MRGWLLAISAYLRLRASCCFSLGSFVWHWSTSTTEEIVDDSENRSLPFFESCQHRSMLPGNSRSLKRERKSPFNLIAPYLITVPARSDKRSAFYSLPLYISAMIKKFSVPAKSCQSCHCHDFAAHIFCVLINCIPNVTFARPFPPRVQYKRKEGSSSID